MIMLQVSSWIHKITQRTMTTKQNVCQVQILPWGVQISEFTREIRSSSMNWYSKDEDQMQKSERNLNRKTKFIPLENVVDIIVSEVVLSYKVKNCVMFRIKKWSDDTQEKRNVQTTRMLMASGNMKLIPAFSSSMVEMSYIECTHIWQAMSEVLSKYQQ